MRQRSDRAAALAPFHQATKRIVVRRAKGLCGACKGRLDVDRGDRTEWEHIFKRGHLIAEPLCSTSWFTEALHRSCHRRITDGRDKEKAELMGWTAVDRCIFALRLEVERYDEDTPLDVARRIERMLTEQGRMDEVRGR
jgi:hypothetical protein